jgi:hypothetical protein
VCVPCPLPPMLAGQVSSSPVLAPVGGRGRGRTGRRQTRRDRRRPIHRVAEEAKIVVLARVGHSQDLPAAVDPAIKNRRLLRRRPDEGLVHPDCVLVHHPEGTGQLDRLDLGQSGQAGEDGGEARGRHRGFDPPRAALARGRGHDLQARQRLARTRRRLVRLQHGAQLHRPGRMLGQGRQLRLYLEMRRRLADPGDEGEGAQRFDLRRIDAHVVAVGRNIAQDGSARRFHFFALQRIERPGGHRDEEPAPLGGLLFRGVVIPGGWRGRSAGMKRGPGVAQRHGARLGSRRDPGGDRQENQESGRQPLSESQPDLL